MDKYEVALLLGYHVGTGDALEEAMPEACPTCGKNAAIEEDIAWRRGGECHNMEAAQAQTFENFLSNNQPGLNLSVFRDYKAYGTGF